MNIFTKTALTSILESKIKSREISAYKLTEAKLVIHRDLKSRGGRRPHKLSSCTIDITGLSGDELLKLLYREIPDNITEHFKVEIRNVKLRRIL